MRAEKIQLHRQPGTDYVFASPLKRRPGVEGEERIVVRFLLLGGEDVFYKTIVTIKCNKDEQKLK